MKYLFKLLVIMTFPLYAQASGVEETPLDLAQRYINHIAPGVKIDRVDTDEDAFKAICEVMNVYLTSGGVLHHHSKKGPDFGYSFTEKNRAPIEFVADMLTGKKSWKQETLQSTQMTIADVGCGLGLSALLLISKVTETYQKEGWTLSHPIQLDLFDVNHTHQSALQSLVKIINKGCPYFQLTSSVQDVSSPFPHANHYKVVFALNLMHYVPEMAWRLSLENMVCSMKKNGLLFMTTDHYQSSTTHVDQCTDFASHATKATSPFLLPCVLLHMKETSSATSNKVRNLHFLPFLKAGINYSPAHSYGFDDIDEEALKKLFTHHLAERRRSTLCLFSETGTITEEVSPERMISYIQTGEVIFEIGNYGFDDLFLQRAVRQFMDDSRLRELKSPWTKNLLKTALGGPSSVGLTFQKL